MRKKLMGAIRSWLGAFSSKRRQGPEVSASHDELLAEVRADILRKALSEEPLSPSLNPGQPGLMPQGVEVVQEQVDETQAYAASRIPHSESRSFGRWASMNQQRLGFIRESIRRTGDKSDEGRRVPGGGQGRSGFVDRPSKRG